MTKRELMLLGAAALAGVGVFFASGAKLPPCMFYEVTGLYCPGCGSTRAILRMLHGNVTGAFKANTLFWAVVPYILYLAGGQIMAVLSDGRYKPREVSNWTAFTVVGVLLAYWVLRNIPVYPLNLLAPH